MNKKNLEYFENLLLEKRKRKIAELQDIEERIRVSQQDYTSELSLYPNHEADIASDAESREENVHIAGNRADILGKIDRALKKTSNNEYGICEDCSKEIERKRLECIPYARYCIKCEERREGKK